MKLDKQLFSWLLLSIVALISLGGCSDDLEETRSSRLEVSIKNIDAPSEGATIELQIKSNVHWTITSTEGWVTPTINEGHGDQSVELIIAENLYRNSRTDIVTVSTVDGTQNETIEINQAIETNPNEHYKYKIPVVFHVIYRDPNNERQNLREGYLQNVLTQVNKIWANAAEGLNVEFIMATETPNGVK